MSVAKLLIVEDDEGLCGQYRWAFPGLKPVITHRRAQALAALAKERPGVVVLDLGLPPDPDGVSEGFATLEEILRAAPATKVILATGSNERENALRAIAAGAYDFYEKPIDIAVLRGIVDRALRLHELEAENKRLAEAAAQSPLPRIITAAEPMLKICRDIEKLAATNVPVLLLGESGTGKEALARALHDLGPRAKGPFIALNCGAIPENLLESELFGHERGAFTGAVRQTLGKIEMAHLGTLFLDEIGDLPHPLQVKLLRVLQDQVIERIGGRQRIQVDVRIVSATNQGIETEVAAGRFRGDLFYRLNSVTLRIPPLRARDGDAVLLARYFLHRFNDEFHRNVRGLSETAVAALTAHDWPGNVRELENRMKRAVVMSETRLIEPADLELEAPAIAADGDGGAGGDDPNLDLRTARSRAERDVIERALARSGGNLSTAAQLLGVSRTTLYGLLRNHGLEASLPDGATQDITENR